MDDVGAIDLGYKGYKYTWENRQVGQAKIKESIDRAVASSEWITLFPLAVVEHLCTENSDHTPILVHTTANEMKGIRPFCLLEAWT